MRNNIRHTIFNYNKVVRSLMLTDKQIRLIKYIESTGGCASPKAAKKFKVNIQTISTMLKKLVEKGYLFREKDGDPSGGVCYLYKAIRL